MRIRHRPLRSKGGMDRRGRVPWGRGIRPVGGVMRVPGADQAIHVSYVTFTCAPHPIGTRTGSTDRTAQPHRRDLR